MALMVNVVNVHNATPIPPCDGVKLAGDGPDRPPLTLYHDALQQGAIARVVLWAHCYPLDATALQRSLVLLRTCAVLPNARNA